MFWRRRRRTAEDFEREIASHLDIETARLIADGLSEQDARAAARRRFGNATRVSERFYESRRVLWWDHLRQDVRCATRSVKRTPVACAVAIASLAAGIGATTATLTLRNAIFYNPPPLYRQPSELSRVAISTPQTRRTWPSGALYDIWNADPALNGRLAAATPGRGVDIRVGDRLETRSVRAVTANLFSLLGVEPALGRSFSPALDSGGAPPVVLSQQVWQSVFDGRADIIGTTVWLDQQAYTVIGVMPEGFWFGNTGGPMWTYLAPERISAQSALDVVVRRPARLSTAALAELLQPSALEYARRRPDGSRELRVLTVGIGGTGLGDQMGIVIPYLVGAAVLLTLLIACANVAILMFARWTGREREMAIRSSLGAGRARVIALLLTESVTLAVCGGVLGVCTTFALRGVFIRNARGATSFDLSIDFVILAQAALVTVAAGILAGLAPAIYETRRLHTNPLRLLSSSDRVRQRWRHALVVLEIAVTVALMVVAAAQVDASRRMLTANVGLPTATLLSTRVENPAGVDVARVLEALTRTPGVAGAAAGSMVPMGSAPSEPVTAAPAGSTIVSAERIAITPGYFTAIDVPMRAGRPFTEAEMSGAARVAIVNETLARQLWADRDALGGRIIAGGQTYDVVGVVAGYWSNPLRGSSPRFYLPLKREPKPTRMQFAVRATHDPRPLIRAIRKEIGYLGSTYTVPTANVVKEIIEIGAMEILALALAMSPLLGIGVFLTATGIFGVLAFAISRRAKELALRVALGASRREVGRLVVAHTIRLLAIGALLGVGVTFGLTKMVAAAGGGGTSFDTPGWEAFAVPVAIVLAVGALATWIPARRALRIDPAMLLKTE